MAPSRLDEALGWLAGQAGAIEALVAELVEISSHTADRAGCGRVAAHYAAALGALAPSLSVRVVAGGRSGDHVVARSAAAAGAVAGGPDAVVTRDGPGAVVTGDGSNRDRSIDTAARPVLLVGHHDTVFPAATFSGYRVDGPLARGPGVLDMKGGLAVIAFALGALEAAGLLARLPVELVSVSDEEIGSPEGRDLVLAAARRARATLVFESGRASDVIVTARKGTGGVTAVATGRAAHAGNLHHEGANAIWALARFIDCAQALTDYGRGLTLNVGRVAGGLGKNTVPDRAEAEVDLRFVAAPDGEALVEALRAAAREAAASVPGTAITVSGGVTRRPLVRTPASAALAAAYGACARAAGLGDGEAPLLGGGSDANTAAEAGCPAIDGLGPRGRGFHTLDEHIERATLLPKAAALTRYLVSGTPT